MRPDKFCRARLVERVDFSHDLAVFRFRPDTRVPFRPGQYCTIGRYGADGEPILRAYSIVSAPHDDCLELFIELVDDGALTPLLWPLREGDEVWLRRKIVGRFTLDASATRHAMAATVTGVAPYLSMARAQRHALATGAQETPHHFLVVHGASRASEFGRYHDELVDLARESWLTYVPTVSRPWEDPDWDGEVGRVEDVLRKHMDAAGFGADAAAYACGHPQMIENAMGIFRRRGLSPERIHEEKYFTSPTAEAEKLAAEQLATQKPQPQQAQPQKPQPEKTQPTKPGRPAPPAFAPALRAVKTAQSSGESSST